MLVEKIGKRGVLFTFDDAISVYLINAAKRLFLCDTHLGPLSMKSVKEYISDHFPEKEMVVFNSHSDWDHVWGNCAFPEAVIVGHQKCRERLEEIGAFELERLVSYHRGDIEIVVPNLTFSEKMAFEDDEIELIYTPGHTIDSAVCFDKRDSVLFVGDLVEEPIPYLDYLDLQTYIGTLESIRSFPAEIKISAHSGIINDDLILKNIGYIRDILTVNPINPEIYQDAPDVHNFNLNNRLFLYYEGLVREKSSGKFNYHYFRDWFGDLKKIRYNELKEALERYIGGFPSAIKSGTGSDLNQKDS